MIPPRSYLVALIISFFLAANAFASRWNWEVALTQYASSWQIAPQSDGKVVIFGDFEFAGRIRIANLARLNSNGSIDLTYNPTLGSGPVVGISPLGDDLLVATRPTYEARLQKLNKDGVVDPSFAASVTEVGFKPSANNPYSFPAYKLASGKILMFGGGRNPGKPTRYGLIRLNADGSLDETFNPPLLSMDGEFSVEATGTILVISGRGFGSQLLRLNGETGETIKTFQGAIFSTDVFALPSGKFLLLGQFPDGREVKRFNNDGSEDSSYTFDPGQDLWRSPIRLRDGNYFWLGSPTMILDPEGELSRTLPNANDFDPNYGGVAEMADGRIVYSANDLPSGQNDIRQTTHGVHRRDRDGILDSTFAVPGGLMMRLSEPIGTRFNIDFGADGALYAAGGFRFVNGTNTGAFARLNADRLLSSAFLSNIRTQTLFVDDFVVEKTTEKTLLVDGRTRLNANGETVQALPSLGDCIQFLSAIPLSNGASIYNYTYGAPCYVHNPIMHSAYRGADGNRITEFVLKQGGFYPDYYSSGVHAAVPAATDGKFLIGGDFTSVNDIGATNLALITAAGQVDLSFNLIEPIHGLVFLLRHGDEYIAIADELASTVRTLYRINQQGTVILKKNFPSSIVSVRNALLDGAGRLVIFTQDYNPWLLISVFDPDGEMVQSLRIPYTASSYQSPVGRISPEGDLMIGGWYAGNDSNAWSGIVRVPAAELRSLRLDVSMANESRLLKVRATAGATVGIYSSDGLETWTKDRSVSVTSEGHVNISLEPVTQAKFFKAQLE